MLTGAVIRSDREARKLSRAKYAELLGPPFTPTKVANIETGRAIRPEELAPLERLIGAARSVTVLEYDPVVYLLDVDDEALFVDQFPDVDTVTGLDVGDPAVPVAPWVPQPVAAAGAAVPPAQVTLPAAVVSALVQVPGDTAHAADHAFTAADFATATARVNELREQHRPAEVTLPDVVGVAALYIENDLRRFSNSEVQTFKHCRRRWWLAWYRGMRPKEEKTSGALALGTRVHLALAAYYVPAGQVPVDPRQELEGVLARDELKALAAVTKHDASDAATAMAEFKKEADLARAMIEGYVEWLAETGADQGYRVVAPEQVLTSRIEMPDGPDMLLAGRLDVRLQREHDGVVLFMDHKTTGSFEQLARMLVWDEQMRHYHLLERGNREPGSPHVAGALYNMLRKVKRSAQATPPFYQRVEVRHNETDLDRFTTRLMGEFDQITEVESKLDVGIDHQVVAYPTPSDRCTWGCEFSAVCPMFDDGSRAEDFLVEHYDRVNPMDRYDDETKDLRTHAV